MEMNSVSHRHLPLNKVWESFCVVRPRWTNQAPRGSSQAEEECKADRPRGREKRETSGRREGGVHSRADKICLCSHMCCWIGNYSPVGFTLLIWSTRWRKPTGWWLCHLSVPTWILPICSFIGLLPALGKMTTGWDQQHACCLSGGKLSSCWLCSAAWWLRGRKTPQSC